MPFTIDIIPESGDNGSVLDDKKIQDPIMEYFTWIKKHPIKFLFSKWPLVVWTSTLFLIYMIYSDIDPSGVLFGSWLGRFL